MVSKYGNYTIYCDSTHNITRYKSISLYVIAVKTNCGFQVRYDKLCLS